jgi:DNA-binding NarL/FixJ family response regulator
MTSIPTEPAESRLILEAALPKPQRPKIRPPKSRGDGVLTPRTRARIGVLVIGEKGIMRDGLCALLSGTEEFEIAGSESTAADALSRELARAPDIVVADFPDLSAGGPEAIANLKGRWPEVRVLVLTFHKDQHTIDSVLRAGAEGYLLKNDSCNELFTALRSIAAGKGFVSASICEHVATGYVPARHPPRTGGAPTGELTERERQVMRFIAAGHRTREIARQLSLSHKTIEKHRTSLMRKLGLRNASAVAAYAIAHGLG